MKFGMPTLLELDDIGRCAELCKRLGLDFVELNMNMPQYQYDQIDVSELTRLRNETGVFFTLHLDENFNACDFNPAVRRAYVETALSSIEIAKRLEMPVINMHMNMGVHFKLPDGRTYLFDKYKPLYLRRIAEFRDACAAAIGYAPLTVCVENTDGFPGFARDGIDLLLQCPLFNLTIDIGHNYCANCVDEPFMLERESRVRHMHVHDSIGARCHQPLGVGEIDVGKWLTLARRLDCNVVLETKTVAGLAQSVEALPRYLL